MTAQVIVTSVAVVVSIGSLVFAWHASRRAARAEDIKSLLGEKETVGFGALKILREGLPGERPTRLPRPGWWKKRVDQQRELIVTAVIAACVFEGSGRARALLFRVVEKYRTTGFNDEFESKWGDFKKAVDSMKEYDFTKKPSLTKADRRLEAVRKVLDNVRIQHSSVPASPADDETLQRREKVAGP